MFKVGLTGGIGSGKTTVATIFTSLGIPVFFADLEARNIMETSDEVMNLVKTCFGDEAYSKTGLNRKYLSDIVFSDPVKLRKLNQIIHPVVHRQFEAWAADQREVPYLVEEAALLYESGIYKYFDFMVLISAPEKKRIERVMKRDGVSEEDVRNRMKSQMPEAEKIPLSQFLIFNDEESIVLTQVLAFHEKLISLGKN